MRTRRRLANRRRGGSGIVGSLLKLAAIGGGGFILYKYATGGEMDTSSLSGFVSGLFTSATDTVKSLTSGISSPSASSSGGGGGSGSGILGSIESGIGSLVPSLDVDVGGSDDE